MPLESKTKILFLVNPKSGVQSRTKVVQLIEKYIDHNKYDFSIEYTQYAGHALILAAAAVERGVNVVVAVGGDGTINEVARSLVHTSTALGVVPRGSGNGFARHLGIPLTIKGAMEFINRAEVTAVDYGTLNGAPFFCACGVGFDALVSMDFAKSNTRGMFTYIQRTLVDWLTYKPQVYEIEAENLNEKCEAFVIACGNASQYGSNAYITPFASMKDGMLSVSVLTPFTPIDVPIVVAQLFSNNLKDNEHMITFRTRWLKIKRKSSGPVHYDGEPCDMEAELFVEIVPSGLNVLAAPGWDGTCAPVPIYKQFYDVIAGVVR